MLKIKDNVDLKELEKFGFVSFKVSKEQTNWYKCISRGCKVILVNNIMREILIDDWGNDDNRIHKNPVCKYKSREVVEDVIFDLVSNGLVEKVIGY